MPERSIPIVVPRGWVPKKWAAYCRHMERTILQVNVRPELAADWSSAAEFADRIAQKNEAADLSADSPQLWNKLREWV